MTNRPVRKAKKSEQREQRKEHRSQNSYTPVELKLRTKSQATAIETINNNDMTFLLGAAGSGKTFLAMAYAINAVLAKQVTYIILTRPIVEAGEKLGFLPGTFGEKVDPYMQPLYDTMDILIGKQSAQREIINKAVVLAPLCYMRGKTFHDAICVFDEAQNATYLQLKLFLSRFGSNSKVIVTGDPDQSDLCDRGHSGYVALTDVVNKLRDVKNIGFHEFNPNDVVRHPLVAEILRRL